LQLCADFAVCNYVSHFRSLLTYIFPNNSLASLLIPNKEVCIICDVTHAHFIHCVKLLSVIFDPF